ncbi:protein kinase domain-containing protein [Nocardia nepalensis]|uniref:serine/threonine-protein kinase n=1 Tax=Nocardia nepalensis TaxID=3375448 RepID=UPI003B67E7D3
MSAESESRLGTRFGRYQVLRLIGRGGMGEVYEAYDTVKDRNVALKLLPEALGADPAYRERFRRESHGAARLSNPHVVPIHDWGEVDGRLYIDMRLIDGPDLRKLLTSYGPMSPARAVSIVQQVASALDAAHADHRVHRDVKPENILITRDNMTGDDFAYLVDFGLATTPTDPRLTDTGHAIGTFTYMAPERFENVEVTNRADVYSLGCVLHECLTGGRPYHADSFAGLIRALMLEPPPKPSAVRPGLSPGFDAVVARGMARDPADRYPSAGDLALAAAAVLTEPERAHLATMAQEVPSEHHEAMPTKAPEEHRSDPGVQHPVGQSPVAPPTIRYPVPGVPTGPPNLGGASPQGGTPWLPSAASQAAAGSVWPQPYQAPSPPVPWLGPPGPQTFAGPQPAGPRWKVRALIALGSVAGIAALALGGWGLYSAINRPTPTSTIPAAPPVSIPATTSSSVPSSPAPSSAQFTSAENKLLQLLPQGYSTSNCRSGKGEAGSVAALYCDANPTGTPNVGGTPAAHFYLYPNLAALNDAYRSATRGAVVPCPDGDLDRPTKATHNGQLIYTGNLACVRSTGSALPVPTLDWTDERDLVLAAAFAGDSTGAVPLFDWWKNYGVIGGS